MKPNWIIIALVAIVIVAATTLFFMKSKQASHASSASTEPVVPINDLLAQAQKAQEQGDLIAAKTAYNTIVNEHPDYDKIEDVQNKLGDLNLSLITSNAPTPQTVIHEVKPGDSLGKLSKQYNTTKELIKKSNHLNSDVIRVGQKLRIWNASFNVFVDKSQNMLTLKVGDEVVKVYNVSTGVNNSTPVGTYTIATKLVKPVWFKPGGEPVAAESPQNELGTRWMGFGEDPHYGIHGTIKPELIGQQATSGCVRLRNDQVEELFDLLPVGTQVVIQD